MKKKIALEPLIDLEEMILTHGKQPGYKAELDRASLRVAIAREIKTVREKAGLTQIQLAEITGLSQPMIGRLESLKDTRIPSLELLAKISVATGKKLVLKRPTLHFELMAKAV